MRGNPHVRFGGRAEETDRLKRRHRASVRSNHTGITLAARSGVSTRDLMTRMGHDSVHEAIIYQHVTSGPFVAHGLIGGPSWDALPIAAPMLTRADTVERVTGIEPA